MIYEVEIVRVDDEFEMLEVDADSPTEAKEIALSESILLGNNTYMASYAWMHIMYEVQKYELLSRYPNCLNPCRHIIVRDEDGKDVYNQLYSDSL